MTENLYVQSYSVLSTEAFCLTEAFLAKLQRSKSQLRYIGTITFQENQIMREFFLVYLDTSHYWADCITGTLYDSTGNCMTSSLRRLEKQPFEVFKNQNQEFTDLLAA